MEQTLSASHRPLMSSEDKRWTMQAAFSFTCFSVLSRSRSKKELKRAKKELTIEKWRQWGKANANDYNIAFYRRSTRPTPYFFLFRHLFFFFASFLAYSFCPVSRHKPGFPLCFPRYFPRAHLSLASFVCAIECFFICIRLCINLYASRKRNQRAEFDSQSSSVRSGIPLRKA